MEKIRLTKDELIDRLQDVIYNIESLQQDIEDDDEFSSTLVDDEIDDIISQYASNDDEQIIQMVKW